MKEYGIEITAEDERYPYAHIRPDKGFTVIIDAKHGNVVYDVDWATGELKHVCICAARSEYECVCG